MTIKQDLDKLFKDSLYMSFEKIFCAELSIREKKNEPSITLQLKKVHSQEDVDKFINELSTYSTKDVNYATIWFKDGGWCCKELEEDSASNLVMVWNHYYKPNNNHL